MRDHERISAEEVGMDVLSVGSPVQHWSEGYGCHGNQNPEFIFLGVFNRVVPFLV